MHAIEDVVITCPYCGEANAVQCECTFPAQNYVEDCQICCQPIVMDITVDSENDTLNIRTRREND